MLVDATDFTSTREMIEKMYLSNDVSGNLVSSFSGEVNKIKFVMGIIDVPVGPTTYMLFGGFTDSKKGYYFQIFLERKDLYNITNDSFNEIYKFNHQRNPAEILDILMKVKSENLPGSFFKDFDNSELDNLQTKSIIEQRKKFENFPTTF